MLNRRHFITTGTSALAAMAAVPNAIANPLAKAFDEAGTAPKKSVQQKFNEKVGDSFLMRSEAGVKRLTLIDVEQGPVSEGLEQFTLIFEGHGELQEELYKATHLKTLNSTLVHLVPSFESKGRYLASFSLLA